MKSKNILFKFKVFNKWNHLLFFIGIILLIVVGISVGSIIPNSKKYNIILLSIDTLRKDHIGCYGYEKETTPNLDRLAADGVLFQNAYSHSPWTLPAFATILTSTYPSEHGAKGSFRDKISRLKSGVLTGCEYIKQNGYETAGFVTGPFLSSAFFLNKGFDVYNFDCGNNYSIRRASGTLGAAKYWLESRKKQSDPFFLFIHLFDPHMNYDPPGDYQEIFYPEYKGELSSPYDDFINAKSGKSFYSNEDIKYIQALYDGEICYTDFHIGQFLNFLKEKNLYNNTFIFFTSDHGEEFWEHGGFEHGHSLYEELVRIPLIIKPAKDYKILNKKIDSRVRHIDIMPTIFDVLNIEIPAQFHGLSLLTFIKNQGSENREVILEGTLYGGEKKAIIADNYKYIFSEESHVEELYCISKNIKETDNLVKALPGIVEQMKDKLENWHKNIKSLADLPDTNVILNEEMIKNLKLLGYIQ